MFSCPSQRNCQSFASQASQRVGVDTTITSSGVNGGDDCCILLLLLPATIFVALAIWLDTKTKQWCGPQVYIL
jgi:hypothetical protein